MMIIIVERTQQPLHMDSCAQDDKNMENRVRVSPYIEFTWVDTLWDLSLFQNQLQGVCLRYNHAETKGQNSMRLVIWMQHTS